MDSKKVLTILFAIAAVGLGLRAYKLGAPVLVTDEFLEINAAYGYHQTGEWLAWDFNLDRVSDNLSAPRDERAWPYRWQVAQLFRWFPPTEAVARSVSVAWGVIGIVALYFVGRYFSGKKEIGLLASFFLAVSPLGISIDRTLRMYAMLLPVFLLFSWFLFRFFEEEYQGRIGFFRKINEWLGLNPIWFLPALAAGFVSWQVHVLTANIGAAILVYLSVRAVELFREQRSVRNKYSVSILVLFSGAAIFWIFFPAEAGWYALVIKFFKMKSDYLLAVVGDYAIGALAYGMLFAGTYFLFKKSPDHRKALWVSCLFFAILIPAYLVWNYVFGARLIFFIMPFGIILLSSGVYHLADFLQENSLRFKKMIFIGVLAVAAAVLPSYEYLSDASIYEEPQGESNYRRIFDYVRKNSRPGDVLFTRNFRNYYYSGAGLKVYDTSLHGKIKLQLLTEVMANNRRVFAPLGGGDGGFSKDALELLRSQFQNAKTINDVDILRWEK